MQIGIVRTTTGRITAVGSDGDHIEVPAHTTLHFIRELHDWRRIKVRYDDCECEITRGAWATCILREEPKTKKPRKPNSVTKKDLVIDG